MRYCIGFVSALAALALSGCFDAHGCPDVWEPVCGVDGTTYSNGCYADREGVRVAHAGACSDTPGVCSRDLDCEPGFICEPSSGACVPCGCTAEYDPVCGRDGVTYGNACGARCAHVGVAYPGECGPTCGSDAECGPGARCVIYGTTCDGAGAAEPVPCEGSGCGEDRIGPACMDIGYCEPFEPVCSSDAECDETEYCDTSECLPDPTCGPGEACDLACYGRCAPRVVCAEFVSCAEACPFGYATDEMGCMTCECLPPPPGTCASDADCELGETCDLSSCGGAGRPACPPEEPSCDPIAPPMCYGTCVVPA